MICLIFIKLQDTQKIVLLFMTRQRPNYDSLTTNFGDGQFSKDVKKQIYIARTLR